MKPTPIQSDILARIEQGVPRDSLLTMRDMDRHDVASFQWSRDGVTIVAHRTILTQETGNPRLDYRVEMFRITREGGISRL